MDAAALIYQTRRALVLAERKKGPLARIQERANAINEINALRGLPFERNGYGVNKPAAWSRLYGANGGLSFGYYRDFGWRAAFLGGGE